MLLNHILMDLFELELEWHSAECWCHISPQKTIA